MGVGWGRNGRRARGDVPLAGAFKDELQARDGLAGEGRELTKRREKVAFNLLRTYIPAYLIT